MEQITKGEIMEQIAVDADFVMMDTTQVQAESLRRFMKSLGYEVAQSGSGRIHFVTQNKSLKATRTLGFNTAVRLHNIGTDGWETLGQGVFVLKNLTLDLACGGVELLDAYNERLVLNVKFQENKRVGGGVQLQGHMVKVAHPILIETFGL